MPVEADFPRRLCIGLSFAGYNLFSAINRRLANGHLGRWLIEPPPSP